MSVEEDDDTGLIGLKAEAIMFELAKLKTILPAIGEFVEVERSFLEFPERAWPLTSSSPDFFGEDVLAVKDEDGDNESNEGALRLMAIERLPRLDSLPEPLNKPPNPSSSSSSSLLLRSPSRIFGGSSLESSSVGTMTAFGGDGAGSSSSSE